MHTNALATEFNNFKNFGHHAAAFITKSCVKTYTLKPFTVCEVPEGTLIPTFA